MPFVSKMVVCRGRTAVTCSGVEVNATPLKLIKCTPPKKVYFAYLTSNNFSLPLCLFIVLLSYE